MTDLAVAHLLTSSLTWGTVTVPARKVGSTIYTNAFASDMSPGDRFVIDGQPYIALNVFRCGPVGEMVAIKGDRVGARHDG